MPEQQPDRRCGTCKHFRIFRPFQGECEKYRTSVGSMQRFPCWTPKLKTDERPDARD